MIKRITGITVTKIMYKSIATLPVIFVIAVFDRIKAKMQPH